MTILSIRGFDDLAMAARPWRAAQIEASVNTRVLVLTESALGLRRAKPLLLRHDALNALPRPEAHSAQMRQGL